MNRKTLHLNVKKEPFEVMFTGEKPIEFRKPSKWIKSRLFHKDGSSKDYEVVKITLGYGNDKPHFVAKYEAVYESLKDFEKTYSNGLKVEVKRGDYQIIMGDIIERQYEQAKNL